MTDLYAYAAPQEAGTLPQEFPGSEFLEIGIGKAHAATTLAARLASGERPDHVVLFGLCGAYDGPLDVLDICVVGEDCLADEGVQSEFGFMSLEEMGLGKDDRIPMPSSATLRFGERIGAPVVHGATVSTCSGTDELAAARKARWGADVESMEGAAASLVCAAFHVPLVQIRCVSNRTGNRAQADFDLEGACARLQEVIRELLGGSV